MSEKTALVIIDMQNDYLWEKRKSMFSYDSEKLTSAVNKAAHSFSEQGCDVIYIAQMFPNIITNKWFIGFSIKGTPGAELYSGLDKVSDLYFEKNLPDCFSSKDFRKWVADKGYTELVLCGLDECGCVGATAKGALKSGLKATLLKDCTGCRFPAEKQNKMHQSLESAGAVYKNLD